MQATQTTPPKVALITGVTGVTGQDGAYLSELLLNKGYEVHGIKLCESYNPPHLHARYAEFEASIGIEDGDVLAGQLPRKQMRLVQAWIELHRDELVADWALATSGELPYKIDPL